MEIDVKGLLEIGSKLDFNLIEYLFCDSANVCTYIHLKFQSLIKNNDRFGLSIILVIDEFDQQKRIE